MRAAVEGATSLARSTDSTTSAYDATAAALLLCRPPMKCQRRSRSAHSAAFASASWWRFSPTSVTPSSASSRTSEAGKNLVTADQGDVVGVAAGGRGGGLDPSRTAARLAASSSRRVGRSCGRHPDHAGLPAGRRGRRGGRSRGRATRGCSRDRSTHPTPPSASWAVMPAPRSSDGRAPARWWPGGRHDGRDLVLHLGRHLVAAAAHVRAQPGGDLAGAELAHPVDRRRDDAGHQAGAPGVGSRRSRRPSASANSTGTQSAAAHHQRHAGLVGDHAVGAACRWPWTSVRGPSGPTYATSLPWTWLSTATGSPGAKSAEQAAVVLGQGVGVVARPGEVERVEGRATDPAVPVREGQRDGAVGQPRGVQTAPT